MTPELRRFSVGDAKECYDVFYHAVHIGAASQYSQSQRNAWAPHKNMPENWPQKLSSQACWVAQVNATIVGFFSLEADGHLDMAYVAPEFRRTTVAEKLHVRIIQDAQDLELARLFTEASHLARAFLEKRGWHVTSPETVTRRGVKIDRFQMALDLH